MTKQGHRILNAALLSLLTVLTVQAAAAAAAAPASEPPPAPSEVVRHANELLLSNRFDEAEQEFRRAESLLGGRCGECGLGIATVRASEGKWNESVDLIQRSLPLLTTPATLAWAYNQLGMAYVKGGGGADRLAQAETALRNAVDYGGPWGDMARRNLAQVLLLEGRWADSAQAAREALQKAGAASEMAKATRIILCQARSHLPDELPVEGEGPVSQPTTHPEKITGSPPEYTAEARAARTAGVVILESTIDREGCVRHPKIVRGLPNGLSEAALESFRLWVYSPATFEGKPVDAHFTLTINFAT